MSEITKNNKEINHPELNELPVALQDILILAKDNGDGLHVVEEKIFDKLLKIGHQTLEAYLALQGNGDRGETLLLDNGKEVKRLDEEHSREYLSIFGRFSISRVVYGTREGQAIQFIPLDVQLQLPVANFSYLLQNWNQELVQECPYNQVAQALKKILKLPQSTNSLERGSRQMGDSVHEYLESIPTPPPEEEGKIFVIQSDHKGIAMRKEEQPGLTESSAAKEEPLRKGEKKMALVGAAYSVDDHIRTPEQMCRILMGKEQPEGEELPSRPKPCHKHVRAILQRDEAGTTQPQTEEGYQWLADEVMTRNPDGLKPTILLCDGQESLWTAGLDFLPPEKFDITEIIDIMHVNSYLWAAIHLFYPINSNDARKEMEMQLLRLLSGNLEQVINSLKWQATYRKLDDSKREKLDKIIAYFLNNKERMHYDDYLAKGYPIASGVIEGACRSVVKDRMERSGMRWTMKGAHAVLSLRSVHSSQLWDGFIPFFVAREQAARFPHRPMEAANDENFSSARLAG